ncbi:unnamed protein product [Choristocarpus tenellus]
MSGFSEWEEMKENDSGERKEERDDEVRGPHPLDSKKYDRERASEVSGVEGDWERGENEGCSGGNKLDMVLAQQRSPNRDRDDDVSGDVIVNELGLWSGSDSMLSGSQSLLSASVLEVMRGQGGGQGEEGKSEGMRRDWEGESLYAVSSGKGPEVVSTEDSLKASERSEDSLSAWRAGPALAIGVGGSPASLVPSTIASEEGAVEGTKRSVSMAWDMGAAGGLRMAGLERDDSLSSIGGVGEEKLGSPRGELAEVFQRKASAFIKRSRAREEANRRKREDRRLAREKVVGDEEKETSPLVGELELRGGNEEHSAERLGDSADSQEQHRVQRAWGPERVVGGSPMASSSRSSRWAGRGIEGENGPRRVSVKEARMRTNRLYNNLPEVKEARERKEKEKERIRRLLSAREQEKLRSRRGGGRRGSGRREVG